MVSKRPSGHRKRTLATITAVGLAISGLNSGVSAQAQYADFAGMITTHNKTFNGYSHFTWQEDAKDFWCMDGKCYTELYSMALALCPSDLHSWKPPKITNFDSNLHGGVGGSDRFDKAFWANRDKCDKSLDNIRSTAERSSWTPGMEVLATTRVLHGSTQGSGSDERPIAPELVSDKRAAFLNDITQEAWSESLEGKANQIRPYVTANAVDSAIAKPRAAYLAKFETDKKPWSSDWAQQLEGIAKYDPENTNRVLDARFNTLLDSFRNDGQPWSKDWEKNLDDTTYGATTTQRELVTKLISERRANVVASFKNDGRSWTPEWDKSIEEIASVSPDATKIRQERRQDYIRNVTVNRPWNEVDDRQFQNFLQDHTSQKVKIDQSSLDAINTWRSGAIAGLSQNRVWSPELEVEFSYLVTNYPEARKQMEQVRAAAADKAEKSIADKGWSLEADTMLLKISEFQFSPYGSKLQQHRVEALETLKNTPWSAQVDQKLEDLASVYPMAADAAEKLREETFAATEVPAQWSPDVEDALGELAEAGHQPAVVALDTLRATYLAELESLPWSTAVDIELSQLAEFYEPAREVYEERRGTHTNPGDNSENPGSDDDSDDDSQNPGSDDDSDDDDSDQSDDRSQGSSPSQIQDWIGIVVAIISALGMALPLIQQFTR